MIKPVVGVNDEDDYYDEELDESFDEEDSEADEIFQEVIETVEALKKIGNQNNQLLHHMITSQK